jgi:hypothetical protein
MKTQKDIEDKLNTLPTAKERRLMLLQWYKQNIITVSQIEQNLDLMCEPHKNNRSVDPK